MQAQRWSHDLGVPSRAGSGRCELRAALLAIRNRPCSVCAIADEAGPSSRPAAEPRTWGANWGSARRVVKKPSPATTTVPPEQTTSPSGPKPEPLATAGPHVSNEAAPPDSVLAEDITRRLADRLRSTGAIGSCLIGSAILHELLQRRGLNPRLQKGFLVMDGRVGLWHVWVELPAAGSSPCLQLDVAWMSQEAAMPAEARPRRTELVLELAPGLIRLDGESEDEREMLRMNEESWEAVQRLGLEQGFWARQPPASQWLRQEMLQQIQ